jgi:hypothetical protein
MRKIQAMPYFDPVGISIPQFTVLIAGSGNGDVQLIVSAFLGWEAQS